MHTLNEFAYQQIRERLLVGDLGPAGSRVSDLRLAAEIGISRTPIREALNQLVSEGLLDRRPRSGVFVRIPDNDEIEELFDLREVIEGYAVSRASSRITPAQLEKLRGLSTEMQNIIVEFSASGLPTLDAEFAIKWFTADSAFHLMLLQISGNRKALKVANELRIMTQILGHRRMDHDLPDLQRIYNEHNQIIEQVAEGNGRQAQRHLMHHIRESKVQTLAILRAREKAAQQGKPVEADWPQPLRQLIYRIESMFSEHSGGEVPLDPTQLPPSGRHR